MGYSLYMESKLGKTTRTLLIISTAMFLSVLIYNFYSFYFLKSYTLLVETPCGENESCFIRSCEGEECPPSGLESYRLYAIKASDFSSCVDESCISMCQSGSIECEEIICSDSPEETCSSQIP
jgi:hypothetical protein